MGIADKIKSTVDAVKAGNAETDGIGNELHERAAMTSAALGNPTAPIDQKPRADAPTAPWEHVKRAPIKGQKPISPKDLAEWTKPLGSYKDGCDSVPKTGVYKLHEGEKVVPAHQNPDNADKDTNAVEDAFMEHSPEEKAHFHRAMSKLHTGGLHRHLGIAEDKPIPMEKKQEAANSDNPHVAAMGRMAVAMHGWKHK